MKNSKAVCVVLSIVVSLLFCDCNRGLKEVDIGKIDTHIHLYDTEREGSCVFLDPERHSKIYYPHLPDEFLQVSKSTEVTHAIVVEASARPEDNDWLIEVVNGSDNMLGCIANIDPRNPEFTADVKRFAENEKFRGIRIRNKEALDISDPQIVQSLGILDELGLVLELGPNQQKTGDIVSLAKKYTKMNIIMNHLAGGRMVKGEVLPEGWKERLKALASQPNIYCKVSALYHLSGENPAPLELHSYKPLIDPVVNAFGSDRVLFGSNWTLSEMRGSYKNMILILDKYCREKSDLTSEQFFTLNALKAYRINVN